MANYALSILKNAQVKISTAFQNGEFRFISPETHQLFQSNSANVIPNYAELMTRQDRAIEANYNLRTARATTGVALSHNHTGTVGDSAVIVPTFVPYNDKFAVTLKGSDNKILTQDEIILNEFQNAFINVMQGLESAAQSKAFASRSTVNTVTTDGSFDAVDDVFKISEATLGEQAVSVTEMVMRLNGWGAFTIIADPVAYRKFKSQRNQGSGNSTNTSFQFDNLNVILANDFASLFGGLTASYTKGAWIAVPTGTVASLPWITPQHRNGVDVPGVATYGSIINPIDGISLGVHSYQTRADGTSLGGSVQDVITEFQLGLFMAHEVAPISTGGSPLQAFVLA